jgi:hypothetical protein
MFYNYPLKQAIGPLYHSLKVKSIVTYFVEREILKSLDIGTQSGIINNCKQTKTPFQTGRVIFIGFAIYKGD